MIIPEDILQKQLCSDCQKYLSVGPIKVYPNRQVKCGRCSTDEDFGVESPLYQSVLMDMKIPCVNRYDGCNTALAFSQILNHESDCLGGIYECFLCSEFRGTAYKLRLHCQNQHQKETLQNSEFLFDLHNNYQNKVFFHAKGIRLFFVHYNFDTDVERLTLDIMFIGKCFKGNMSYSLRLYSIEKELLYKTKPSLCSVMEVKLGTRAVVNISSRKFPKKLAICQFFINEEPKLTYIEKIPIIDSLFDTCILKCAFKNIGESTLAEPVVFPAVYYLKGIEWQVFIKRKLSLTDYKRKFGVFLQWEKPHDTVESCKVSATFSLISSDFGKRLSRSFVKKEYRSDDQSHGLMLADWNYVVDPTSGFLVDKCLNIEAKIRIYLDRKKEVKCNDCHRNCIYCSD